MVVDSNFNTTGASQAELNLLGQALFDPPTLGSSENFFFISDSPGGFASSLPACAIVAFDNGVPVGNFGWQFTVEDEVEEIPEPSTTALFVIGLLGIAFVSRYGFSRSR